MARRLTAKLVQRRYLLDAGAIEPCESEEEEGLGAEQEDARSDPQMDAYRQCDARCYTASLSLVEVNSPPSRLKTAYVPSLGAPGMAMPFVLCVVPDIVVNRQPWNGVPSLP